MGKKGQVKKKSAEIEGEIQSQLTREKCKELILRNQHDSKLIENLLEQRPDLKLWHDFMIPKIFITNKKSICQDCPLLYDEELQPTHP